MYSKSLRKLFKKEKIDIGDEIEVLRGKETYRGILMPRTMGDDKTIVLKLDNGYNIGIKSKKVNLVSKSKKKEEEPEKKLPKNPSKPNISIISMGGTITSKIDYKTGAVTPIITASELVKNIPELADIANVECREVESFLSENIEFKDHKKLINEIKKDFKKNYDGIIVTHGTDTLHFTAAAIAFAIENPPVPILLVGSQRSSDRASSDGPMNLICAAQFIKNTNFSDIGICMHATESDNICLIHPACKTRKMHTSRRDAFKTVNSKPIAAVYPNGEVESLEKQSDKRDKTKIKNKFESKVALIKIHPNMESKIIDTLTKNNYKGLVLEGTGLGHAPIKIKNSLKKFLKKGVVVMTSQCLNGRVNMNVYSTGRELQDLGVLSGEDMLPEVALIKLSWLLANYKKREQIEELIGKNMRGEINERSHF